MTQLAQHVSSFFGEHLPRDRNLSPHTVASYAHCFRLFLPFVAEKVGLQPSKLLVEHISADLVLEFLSALENDRGNSVSTRNARLAAIKSFFRYLELRAPVCIELSRQVHAIYAKRCDQPVVDYLDRDEVDALLNAPDLAKANGVRDRAMLHVAYVGGLRVSELVGLKCASLEANASRIRIVGKGRKHRVLPLWKQTATLVRAWLDVRPAVSGPELFLNAKGCGITRHGVSQRLSCHAATAARTVPSILTKRISPHVLRHSCAIHLLEATGDIRKVGLWLGHQDLKATQRYLRDDPVQKLAILGAGVPPHLSRGSFRGEADRVMAMLDEFTRT